MYGRSPLSEHQREAAVAWFEKGIADAATARVMGVAHSPVKELYLRWRIHGRGALVARRTKQVYPFELKLALVERFIAGEKAQELAAEAGLSSSGLLKNWAAAYRRELLRRFTCDEPFDQLKFELERIHLLRASGHQHSSAMDPPPQIELLHR